VHVRRHLPRRSKPAATRVGVLARMRVGTKLMLLVLLPVCALLVFASIAAVDDFRDASRLRDFRSAARLSLEPARAMEALAGERTAESLNRLGVRSADRRRIAATQRAVDTAVLRADRRARGTDTSVEVAGRLQRVRRRLDALRAQTATRSIGEQEIVENYGVVARSLFDIVRDLDSARPTRDSGRAADAYVALVQAIEAAEMERVTLAAALVRGTEHVRVRGPVLEAAELDTFRQYAAPRLVTELDTRLSDPAGATVSRARGQMIRDPARIREQVSLPEWLAASGSRIGALRRLERDSARELDAVAAADLDAARAQARREVAASAAVLILVAALGLALSRSITRPLKEVSEAARMLSAGHLASGVAYTGRDEIGDVAEAFRDLQVTADRLADEIRMMNLAVEENRLDERADVAAFEGRWAELMDGINDTMAAFAELHGAREKAESHADRVFELSHDLLCIAGFDGYFKRVNPAFVRLLGHPTETLLSRPTSEFVHPDDRGKRDEGHATLESGEDVRTFELRQLCSDGSIRRVEWSARSMPDEQLIYAVGRDVTEIRRAAGEQAALRRVATLVAKGVAPAEIFAAVSREVRALFEAASAGVVRFQPDGSIAVLGAVPEQSGAAYEDVAATVAITRSATRTDAAVGAPILVEDRLWGTVVVSEGAEPLPAGTEERLYRFTDLVATAIANAHSRDQLTASRARLVTEADAARRRVVRDLHDGAQQRLIHSLIALGLAERSFELDDGQGRALLAEAVDHVHRANEALRELAHGILPADLTRGGLRGGVDAVVERVALPVDVDLPAERFAPEIEATAYFVIAEALTNIVKHAHAARASVSVGVEDDALRIAVRDDGIGGARPDGSGLVGLRDRLEAIDGRLRIDSPKGRGTVVTAEIPLAGHQVAPAAPADEPATPAGI
jgi:PAS domain S-box-containing protein